MCVPVGISEGNFDDASITIDVIAVVIIIIVVAVGVVFVGVVVVVVGIAFALGRATFNAGNDVEEPFEVAE